MRVAVHFPKLSRFDRPLEPVTFGVPFPQGALPNPARIALRDGERVLPAQFTETGRWPGGSVRWLLVHALVDLPGNASRDFALETVAEPPTAPLFAVTAVKTERGVVIDTGSLRFRVPERGTLFEEISLDGRALLGNAATSGFTITLGDGAYSTAQDRPVLEIEEAGPIRAVVRLDGKHRAADGGSLLTYRIRIIAWAGKPYVTVTYQFVHAEEAAAFEIRRIHFDLVPDPAKRPASVAAGEGYYKTRLQESDAGVELVTHAEKILFESVEHHTDCYYGDFWADWRGPEGGLALTVRAAQPNFPKRLAAAPDRLTLDIWPESAEPLVLRQGVAKTHELLFHFHPADLPLEQISVRSLQFQLPDHPTLPPEWHAQSGVWDDVFTTETHARIEALILDTLDARVSALGMLHYGDEPGWSYTAQGRGRGAIVWNNLEYDLAHHLFVHHARLGQRRHFEAARNAAQHWLDVDFCHYSPDPLRRGGLIAHSAHHVTDGVTPSHEWVEGLFEYYHFTGLRDAWDAALAVGENVIRHVEASKILDRPGTYSVRELGWALYTMMALHRETNQPRYLELARRMVKSFLEWSQSAGGLFSPYTDHITALKPFMISVSLNAIKRYHRATGDSRAAELIVRETDRLIEHARSPAGIFFYKELPSLMTQQATGHMFETLAYAYALTRRRRYLEIALRQFEYRFGTIHPKSRGWDKHIEGDALYFLPGSGSVDSPTIGSTLTALACLVVQAEKEGLLAPFEFAF